MRALLPLAFALSAAAQAQDDYTLIGAAARTRPEFDGAASRTVDLVPVLRYYGKPWFARTTQGILEGGARAAVGRDFYAGAQLAYEAGPSGHDPGASIGAHLETDIRLGQVPLFLLGRVRRHLDTDRGTQADLRATVGVYGAERAVAGIYGQATWASARFARAYYGIDAAGLVYASLGFQGSYDLTRDWLLVGALEARRLSGGIRASPIVERHAAAYASAGVAYRF